MNITFDEQTRLFQIDTEHTSYVIGIVDDEGFVGHVYYGPKIAGGNLSYLLRTEEAPFVPSVNQRDRSSFLDSFAFEYPGEGVGDYRESAIAVKTAGGHQAILPCYRSHRIYDGKEAKPGLPACFAGSAEAKTLEISLWDDVLSVEVQLLYSVFSDSDAIMRSVRVYNHAKDSIYLTKVMSLSLDMDAEYDRMLTLHGSWARERQMQWQDIGYGKHSVGSVRGESSHQFQPFLAVADTHCTQESGEVYGFHFVYSGNFLAQVEKSQFDSLRISMGIHPQYFCYEVKPEDCFDAPETVIVYSDHGLGGMSRTYHDLYRQHLIRSPYRDKKRPILINNWEATYFDFDTEKLLAIAKEAKQAGIEMLVMDDGWFGKRNDDNTSLGDWQVNEEKIKGGLAHLVEEVNRIGLEFGIWFEPEMISPDSALYEAHPDWAIRIPGRTPCRSRNQYVLDLSRPEIVDYVYECVAAILRSANITYVKWDMNRQLTDIGSSFLDAAHQGELMHRYVLGVYALQERLLNEFPNLLLENCSGGGARFDPGMLYYSPQIWCSDDTDAIERLTIQEGTALLYPLSTMGAHVSDCPNHTVGRVTPFETRGHVALAGTFGYELDITKIPEEDRCEIPKQIALYHKYNDLVRTGDYYRIASYRENHQYDCYAVIAKDKAEALVTYVQVLGRANVHSRKIRIPGLDGTKWYRIEGGERLYSGEMLAHGGILISGLWGDYQSKLLHIYAIE